MNSNKTVDQILEERLSNYGSFENHTNTLTKLLDVLNTHHDNVNGESLPLRRIVELQYILGKIVRWVKDPEYKDNMLDVEGYARLINSSNSRDYDVINDEMIAGDDENISDGQTVIDFDAEEEKLVEKCARGYDTPDSRQETKEEAEEMAEYNKYVAGIAEENKQAEEAYCKAQEEELKQEMEQLNEVEDDKAKDEPPNTIKGYTVTDLEALLPHTREEIIAEANILKIKQIANNIYEIGDVRNIILALQATYGKW